MVADTMLSAWATQDGTRAVERIAQDLADARREAEASRDAARAELDHLLAKAEAMHLVIAALAAKADVSDGRLRDLLESAERKVRGLMESADGLGAVRKALGLAPPEGETAQADFIEPVTFGWDAERSKTRQAAKAYLELSEPAAPAEGETAKAETPAEPGPDAIRVLRELTSNAVSMAMILFCERAHPGHCAKMLDDPDHRANWDVLQPDWHEAIKDARAFLAEHDPDGEPLGSGSMPSPPELTLAERNAVVAGVAGAMEQGEKEGSDG